MNRSMPDTQSWHTNMHPLAIVTIVMDHTTITVLDQKNLQQCCSQLHSNIALCHSLKLSRGRHQTTLVSNILTDFTTWYNNQRAYQLWRKSTSIDIAARRGMFQPQVMKSLQQCCMALNHSVELSQAMNVSMHTAWAQEIHRERDLEAHNLEDFGPAGDSSEDEDLGHPEWGVANSLMTAGQWLTIRELGRLQYPPGSSPDSENSSEWSEIHWRD